MKEIYLVRHGESFANKRDFAAFGNVDSPLTEKGIEQAKGLQTIFHGQFDIDPCCYEEPVAVSEYTRAQQTAEYAGFQNREVLPLINESDVDRDIMTGVDVIRKHKAERWVPQETRERACELYTRIKDKDLPYKVYFAHGMFIAGFLLECNVRLVEVARPFDEKRGYVPLQAEIIKLQV